MARTKLQAFRPLAKAPRKSLASKVDQIHGMAAAKLDHVASGGKKPYRFRPGTVAMREIRKYQNSTDFLIPKAPFVRVVKEALQRCSTAGGTQYRIATRAIEAIQDAAEAYLVKVLEDTNLVAIHARRCTIMPRDLALAKRLRGDRL